MESGLSTTPLGGRQASRKLPIPAVTCGFAPEKGVGNLLEHLSPRVGRRPGRGKGDGGSAGDGSVPDRHRNFRPRDPSGRAGRRRRTCDGVPAPSRRSVGKALRQRALTAVGNAAPGGGDRPRPPRPKALRPARRHVLREPATDAAPGAQSTRRRRPAPGRSSAAGRAVGTLACRGRTVVAAWPGRAAAPPGWLLAPGRPGHPEADGLSPAARWTGGGPADGDGGPVLASTGASERDRRVALWESSPAARPAARHRSRRRPPDLGPARPSVRPGRAAGRARRRRRSGGAGAGAFADRPFGEVRNDAPARAARRRAPPSSAPCLRRGPRSPVTRRRRSSPRAGGRPEGVTPGGARRERKVEKTETGKRAASGRSWARQESNLRPKDYESPALTTELRAPGEETGLLELVAPGVGLEPTTNGLTGRCSAG